MRAISDEGMDVSIGDSIVGALRVGTGKALGIDSLGCSPAAFHLTPRSHKRRRRPNYRQVDARETTGRAVVWAAGLEETVERGVHLGCCSRLGRTMRKPAKRPQPEQAEHEEGHEQAHIPMNGHRDPLCLK
jgi:hypothetical protein